MTLCSKETIIKPECFGALSPSAVNPCPYVSRSQHARILAFSSIMAASQRAFRIATGWKTHVFVYVYLQFLLLLTDSDRVIAQSTDTTPGVNDTTVDSTTFSTTPIPTTPTTQAQTTPAATSAPQTAFPSNSDLGPCPCDLTENGCDVNCCCDEDCSDNDRLAFAFCLQNSYLSKTDDKVCFQRNIILIANTPLESNTTDEGLLCIYYDNYVERNFYNIPDIITSDDTERLELYTNRYAGPSFQEQSRVDPRNFSEIYKSGDKIYTVYESDALGVLALPSALQSAECNDNNPAAYLYGQTSTCTREPGELGVSCQTTPALSAHTYYTGFKVVRTPSLFARYVPPENGTGSAGSSSGSSTNTTGICDVVEVDNLYNNSCVVEVTPQSSHVCISSPGGIPQFCNFTNIPTPTYNPTTAQCSDVVSQVEYIITTSGTKGIFSVEVAFVFTNIRKIDLPLTQTFISKFKGLGENAPVGRSGNPGYVVGQPVVAGQVVRQQGTSSDTFILAVQQNSTSPEENALTVLRSSLSGDCAVGTGDRTRVTFGEDLRTGCFISFNVSDMATGCQRMQEVALLALWPYGPDPPRNWSVATFGNSDPHVVGDWVNILVQNAPRGAVSGSGAECVDMVLGMNIQILYANVGSLQNPQPKIVGVSFIYENPQTIAFQCTGPYCQPGSESALQRFEVIQSVSFVDVSQPSVEMYAEPPLFLAKVPYDFFYPFGLGSGTDAKSPSLLSLSVTIGSSILFTQYLVSVKTLL